MTRRTETVPEEPPDFLTVCDLAAILRLSRGKAYKEVRRGLATDGHEGIPAERVDKQFRISRYVIEERLGGPITWPIPGFHNIADTRPPKPTVDDLASQHGPEPDTPPAKPSRRKRSNPFDPTPDTQLRLFPL